MERPEVRVLILKYGNEGIGPMVARTAGVDTGGSSGNTTVAAITHVLGLFAWLVGPLVVLVLSEDEFVGENARSAVNWQICLTAYSLVALAVSFALARVGFLAFPALGVLNTVSVVIAAVKAAGGETWHYPFAIDLL